MSADQQSAPEIAARGTGESRRVVIPFPVRKVQQVRQQPAAEPPVLPNAPARIDGRVKFSQLLAGLSSAGLLFRHDVRTGEFVILLDPEVRT